jgi:hypothetical protein
MKEKSDFLTTHSPLRPLRLYLRFYGVMISFVLVTAHSSVIHHFSPGYINPMPYPEPPEPEEIMDMTIASKSPVIKALGM